ncbi:hypothetical protein C7C46_29150 [Streptomyces tateyamensis]|uniref:Uncharacterized protein n=1 Tax=Streptomyces tateyamensis TaxID=565073 RepID=A0A2V4N1C9_9ACTN|nr:hypothetical protein C7C46_29150 [Streptomyces tateyamensis]
MAVAPESLGAGRLKGAVTESCFPSAVVTDASGPVPPPDNLSEFGVTAGLSVPSGLVWSVASIAAHPEPCLTRTGAAESSVVSVPLGFTTVEEVAVVSASTGTDLPVDFACTRAFAMA